MFRTLTHRFLFQLRSAAKNERAVAAVEFGLILPVLIILALGVSQVGAAVVIKTKVRTIASTIGQISSQYQSIKNSDMNTILGAASVIVSPYATGPLSTVISQITVDSSGKGVVNWSDTFQGTARGVGSKVTIPAGLATNGAIYLMSETNYNYTPVIGTTFVSSVTLSETIYLAPRSAASVSRVP